MGGGDRPGDLAAPVDAGEMETHAGAATGLGDFDDVGDEPVDGVIGGVGRIGPGTRRIAALVRRDGAKTGVGEGCELVGPGVAGLRKAVEEQASGPSAGARDPGIERQTGAGRQLGYVHDLFSPVGGRDAIVDPGTGDIVSGTETFGLLSVILVEINQRGEEWPCVR